MRAFAAVALCFLVATVAIAEIAPEYYAADQNSAPEYLVVEVLRVERPLLTFSSNIPISANLRVLSVHRSASGLQPGDEITVRYEHFRPQRGWTGPRPIPVLQKGQSYPAFLAWSPDEGCYGPAARGASFEPAISPN